MTSGRSIRIQETMTNDLTDHLFGTPIVGLWPARFALQSQGALTSFAEELKNSSIGAKMGIKGRESQIKYGGTKRSKYQKVADKTVKQII
jgi:hypothetical protein